jgi:opacity protein-like surface antigen
MTNAVGFGQDMARGQVEATGQLGLVGGIGTHASIGGSLGYAYTERIFLQGELSYIPLGGGSVSILNVETSGSAKAINFNASAYYLFPTSGMVAPYAGGGLGITRTSANVSTTAGGVNFSADSSATDLYVNFGGGLRYHMNDRWGFKPELMIFAGSETYIRVAAGVFYQFGR